MNRIKLGINIDHVATLRQARGTRYPEPVLAALLAEEGGADGITVHLREDRRHIQDRDVRLLSEVVTTKLNLEMAVTDEMIGIACDIKPTDCCLVPEKRQELTTEGGLDVAADQQRIDSACARLSASGIHVSLFTDPDPAQLKAAAEAGAAAVELHTGRFANASDVRAKRAELERLHHAAEQAHSLGLTVNAGHGLHYGNTSEILGLKGLNELNIGHAIIARAVVIGIRAAVTEMKSLIRSGCVR